MPRYDDHYGNTRLYVGRLSSRTRSRDLEDIFSRYGRVRDVDLKHDFAFIEFSDPRDADDARYSLNGRDIDGTRIVVEFARGPSKAKNSEHFEQFRGSSQLGPRGPGGSREYLGRGPPPGSGRCFNCGIDGHWARDCKAGDWKNKCYRCGERGHIERNCQNSPKNLKRSYSRSPSPRRAKGRSYSRSHSYSRSRSPRRDGRNAVRERSRSPRYSHSPKRKESPPPSKVRRQNPSPDRQRSASPEVSPQRASPLPREREYSGSPRKSRSPPSRQRDSPNGRYKSPEANGRNGRSPSPLQDDDRSPMDDDRRRSPAGRSESPVSAED